jgi:hypothetical protein
LAPGLGQDQLNNRLFFSKKINKPLKKGQFLKAWSGFVCALSAAGE